MDYDLIVIGAGPAGYETALEAANLGKKVALVDCDNLGGTCLNRGCIPTKSLISSASLLENIKKSSDFGIDVDSYSIDFKKIFERSKSVIKKLNQGVAFLLKKAKVDVLGAKAKIIGENLVELTFDDGALKSISADYIIIATGAKPRKLDIFDYSNPRILTSDLALNLQSLPKSVLIIGAGAIGVELAYIWNALGVELALLEIQKNILPLEDLDSATLMSRALSKKNIKIFTDSSIKSIAENEKSFLVEIASGTSQKSLEFEYILVCAGVSANVPECENVSLNLDKRGFIEVDENYKTSLKNVFAIGDVNGRGLLAHVASHQAKNLVHKLFEAKDFVDIGMEYPTCIYSKPELASVGNRNYNIDLVYVKKQFFLTSGKAVSAGKSEGFVKLVFDKVSDKLIFATIVGDNATELIAICSLAIKMGATASDLKNTMFAHPTLAETIGNF